MLKHIVTVSIRPCQSAQGALPKVITPISGEGSYNSFLQRHETRMEKGKALAFYTLMFGVFRVKRHFDSSPRSLCLLVKPLQPYPSTHSQTRELKFSKQHIHTLSGYFFQGLFKKKIYIYIFRVHSSLVLNLFNHIFREPRHNRCLRNAERAVFVVASVLTLYLSLVAACQAWEDQFVLYRSLSLLPCFHPTQICLGSCAESLFWGRLFKASLEVF